MAQRSLAEVERGLVRRFPVSYSLGPSVGDLLPLAAAMIRETFDPRDSLGAAIRGIGYIYPRHYAADFGLHRDKVVAGFNDLTARYVAKAGLRWGSVMDYGGPGSGVLEPFFRDSAFAALVGGYGRETSDAAKAAEMVGPVAVFHSVSRMAGADEVMADILQAANSSRRPLFLYAFVGNWSVSPGEYRKLAACIEERGMQPVDPESLAFLYRTWCDEQGAGRATSSGG